MDLTMVSTAIVLCWPHPSLWVKAAAEPKAARAVTDAEVAMVPEADTAVTKEATAPTAPADNSGNSKGRQQSTNKRQQ